MSMNAYVYVWMLTFVPVLPSTLAPATNGYCAFCPTHCNRHQWSLLVTHQISVNIHLAGRSNRDSCLHLESCKGSHKKRGQHMLCLQAPFSHTFHFYKFPIASSCYWWMLASQEWCQNIVKGIWTWSTPEVCALFQNNEIEQIHWCCRKVTHFLVVSVTEVAHPLKIDLDCRSVLA